LDHETMVCQLGGSPIPIHQAQMMVDEAGRVLAKLRMLSDAAQARAQQEAAARTKEALNRVSSTARRQ